MAQKYASQLRGYANDPARLRNDPTFPIFELGYARGKQDVRDQVLGYVQAKFIDDIDRPERNTPEYQYLLNFAQELAELIRPIKLETEVDNEG